MASVLEIYFSRCGTVNLLGQRLYPSGSPHLPDDCVIGVRGTQVQLRLS